jgi:hypothetical protein
MCAASVPGVVLVPRAFLLGRNSAGHWVVRESSGCREGVFRTREAAIKYARDEGSRGNVTIIDQPNGLELGAG